MYRSIIKKIQSIRYKVLFNKFGLNNILGKRLTLGGCDCIEIGNNVVINNDVWLEAVKSYNGIKTNSFIKIGDGVSIGKGSIITSTNNIKIGNGCLFGPYVFLTDHSHGSQIQSELLIPPIKRNLYSKGPIIINENVWIGYGAVILPGVEIGHSSIIGANAVITKDVEAYSLVVGNPGRVIKNLKNSEY